MMMTKRNLTTLTNTNEIDPNYISGLTQADGSFSCGTSIVNTSNNSRIRFTPKFDLVVDLDSIDVIYAIQKYYGCGYVVTQSDNTAHYIVTDLDDLRNIIVPHFNKFPVFFNKLHAFNLLKAILVLLTKKNIHRDNIQILQLALSMNKASKRTEAQITKLYATLGVSEPLPLVEDTVNTVTSEFTPAFLAGMVDGDGSFNVSFTKEGTVKPALSLCIGTSAYQLIDLIKKYLGPSGGIEKSGSVLILKITTLDQLLNFVIPFFNNNRIHTEKWSHFQTWSKVCMILKNDGKKLPKSSLLKIIDLAYDMNKSGKRRKLTKTEYIKFIDQLYS